MDWDDGGSSLGQFARVRVFLNITRPLRKFIRIKTEWNEDDVIILLVYEKLPDFGYACEMVGHTLRDCYDDSADRSSHEFGPWLRAATHIRWGKKSTVHGVKLDSTHREEDSHSETDNHVNQRLREMTLGKQHADPMMNMPIIRQGIKIPIHSLNLSPNYVEIENQSEPLVHVSGQLTVPLKCDIQKSSQMKDERDLTVEHNGLGTEKSNKHWKRRAREKGKEVVMCSDSIPLPGSKSGLLKIDVTNSQESTSPPKKKNKFEDMTVSLTDILAVVATQPR